MTETVPPEVWTDVMADVDDGKLNEAADKLEKWRLEEGSKPLVVQIVYTSEQWAHYGGGTARLPPPAVPAGRAADPTVRARTAR